MKTIFKSIEIPQLCEISEICEIFCFSFVYEWENLNGLVKKIATKIEICIKEEEERTENKRK